MSWLYVCVGAALGAPARYLTDRAVQARHAGTFPWGTLMVNVAGSLLLGLLLGVAASRDVPDGLVAGLGTGFCGTLTTSSSYGADVGRLTEQRAGGRARVYRAGTLVVGVGAAAAAYALAGRL